MADMIRYFGNDVVNGPDCAILASEAELFVHASADTDEHMTAAMMVGYKDSVVYPVSYQMAEAA